MKFLLVIIASCFFFSFDRQRKEIKPVLAPVPEEKALFDSEEIFTITLKGGVRELLNDRSEKPGKHPFVLSYKKADSSEATIQVEMKTRGHFRKLKENCTYPPLQIQFPAKGSQSSSIFSGQFKLKLVMPCKDDDYVIREWLVYKIYNLVTPLSFRARLVQVRFEDSKNRKTPPVFYGLLLEEENQMAARNKAVPVELKIKPYQTQNDAFLTMAVFEYLIGNTDWSVEYLQNIKLIKKDSLSLPITVPYDFDHSGIVNAPYAYPAEQLLMSSIRERRYRGYCVSDLKTFENVIALYKRLKDDIYHLYTSNTLLDEKYIKSTTKYLDEFYATINNPRSWQKDFAYPCDKNGTGNIVIKGLKED